MHSHLSVCPFRTTLLLLLGAMLLTGCTAQDLAQLQQAHDQAVATLGEAQTAQKQITQQITTLPANDPARQALQPRLDQLNQVIAQVQAYVPVLDAAIKSAGTGQIDPTLQQAVAAIPYGSLALAVVALIFGIIKHIQAGTLSQQGQQTQKAFEQVVGAMDAALPAPTPDQQSKVDAVLDTDVKAKVAAARAV
jgi:hypothetical protein